MEPNLILSDIFGFIMENLDQALSQMWYDIQNTWAYFPF